MTSPARGELRERWTDNRDNADRKPAPNFLISQTQARVVAAVHAIPIYSSSVNRMFHVSSARNRASIQAHGLDWARMSGTRGIAGSRQPEVVDGIFLSPDNFTAQFFVRMNNTGGPVDIWAVDDVDPNDLIESGNGFSYVPYRINRQRLTLHGQGLTEDDLPPAVEMHNNTTSSSTAYSSSLTIALADGTVLHGDVAHAYVAQRSDHQ